MKTLKKTLAVILALAMILGMTVTASAAYSDAADITYTEAVDVMTALGVINGIDGAFKPADTLTRAQACKIIAYLVGADDVESTCPFTDCNGHWAKNYIGYCAAEGYVNGVGDNKFDPEGTLTGYAWAKMLLCALGYDAEIEGMVGAGWDTAVAKLVKKVGLDDGIEKFAASNKVSRDEACQLAFNVLTATMVEYDNAGVNIKAGDVEVSMGASAAKALTADNGTAPYANFAPATGTNPETIQFAEEYFPKLTTTDAQADDLGRAGTLWQYKGKDVCVIDDNALLATYVTGQGSDAAQKQLKKDYKGYAVTSFKETLVTASAAPATTTVTSCANQDDFAAYIGAAAGKGLTVEVWGSASAKKVAQVVVITPTFDEVDITSKAATKTVGAYDAYKLGSTTFGKVFSTVVDADVDVTTVEIKGELADGDMALGYRGAEKFYLEAVSTVTGAYTAKSSANVYTIGGESYGQSAATNAANTASIDAKAEQTFYVDANKNVLGVKSAAADPICAVVRQKAVTKLVGDEVKTTYDVMIITAEGEVETLNAGTSDPTLTPGGIYSYKTSSKGVTSFTAYTTEVKAPTSITTKKAALVTGAYANASTKFFVANYEKDDEGNRVPTGTVSVYTGINNVPSYTGLSKTHSVDTSKTADGVAEIVFVVDDTKAVEEDTYVFLLGTYQETADGYEYDAFVKGDAKTITVVDKAKVTDDGTSTGTAVTLAKKLYSNISTGTEANYTKAVEAAPIATKIQNNGNLLFLNGAVDASNRTIADDVDVYVIDTADKTVDVKTGADLTKAFEADGVYVVFNSGNTAVTTVYILVH